MSAKAYKDAGYSFDAPCIDSLDCACRDHDRTCAGPNGCTRSGDLALALKARRISRTTLDPFTKIKAKMISNAMIATSIIGQ